MPADDPLASRSRPHLLYIEDEVEVGEIVVEVLSDAYVVDHAVTGEAGLERALSLRYDVMVVDRRLPGLSGAEVIAAVRTARLTTPILMLTALGAVADRVSGLDAGADDYLVKPFDFTELLARLRALRRGSRAVGSRREIGDWLFTPRTQALYAPDGRRVTLTATETAVLELLTSSPEHVFSRKEILLNVVPDGSAGTVDTYVHHIRRKASPEMIETVRARGYRAGEPG
ncbi:response regulator transcription factor [Microbacterium oryzae]|uniref:response regulator transcription factor n=1 Tax=Microbacterium oryzae TaxID=743009 RepID=UPI0025AED9A6|nr:response regulator transcription factor [Microbacterium oryzae]MDN3310697.1 response regulator transcription factor [Microbacterium oryzae]